MAGCSVVACVSSVSVVGFSVKRKSFPLFGCAKVGMLADPTEMLAMLDSYVEVFSKRI